AKAKLADQRQSRNVRELVEIMAIDFGQLSCNLPSRAVKSPIDFAVRLRWRNPPGDRLQYVIPDIHAPCWNPAGACDSILGQCIGQAEVLSGHNDDKVGSVDSNTSPQRLRFVVFPVSYADSRHMKLIRYWIC